MLEELEAGELPVGKAVGAAGEKEDPPIRRVFT